MLNTGGVEVEANNLAAVVDSGGKGKDSMRVIQGGVPPMAQQVSVGNALRSV